MGKRYSGFHIAHLNNLIEEVDLLRDLKKGPFSISKKVEFTDIIGSLSHWEHLKFLSLEELDHFSENSKRDLDHALKILNTKNNSEKIIFLQELLQCISELSEKEETFQNILRKQNRFLGTSLIRMFDWIDSVFKINFDDGTESEEIAKGSLERYYINSGLHVQSSYSQILLILKKLDINSESIIYDLGSGFGRVGFVVGILYPAAHFFGFEILESRVQKSNQISRDWNIHSKIQFITKDLGQDSESYETANIFYLYDPFQEETYKKVIEKINFVAQQKKIQIVTKGASKDFVVSLSIKNKWPPHQELQFGNICIFKNY